MYTYIHTLLYLISRILQSLKKELEEVETERVITNLILPVTHISFIQFGKQLMFQNLSVTMRFDTWGC